MKKRKKIQRTTKLWKIIWGITVALLLFFVVGPLIAMISTSFKPVKEQLTSPPTIFPNHPTFDNYLSAISEPAFIHYLTNSFAVTICTTVFAIFFATFATFAFTRLNFPGRKLFLVFVVLGQVVPLSAVAVPLYQNATSLGVIDFLPALVIVYLALVLPVAVWMLRSYMANIPKEIEEATLVDGCTPLGAFMRVLLPMIVPGIAATASYIFFVVWQEFLFALVYTTKQQNRTVAVGILDFVGQYETNWGNLMAASILMAIPAMITFLFIQKRLVNGLTDGAVK
jgi:multiple sugar transport system permease protein/raffinose/stachyose/melibiose transport system permease protein